MSLFRRYLPLFYSAFKPSPAGILMTWLLVCRWVELQGSGIEATTWNQPGMNINNCLPTRQAEASLVQAKMGVWLSMGIIYEEQPRTFVLQTQGLTKQSASAPVPTLSGEWW